MSFYAKPHELCIIPKYMGLNREHIRSLWANKWLKALPIVMVFALLLIVRFHVNEPITGDEPHYLLMDYSLIHDHDLNVKNNYSSKNYSSFYPVPLTAYGQVGAQQYAKDSPGYYSIHGIGLPLLILPGYWAAGPTGAAVEMVLLATIVVWLVYLWIRIITKSEITALTAAGILTISLFFNGLVGYIFPDLPILGLILGCLILLPSAAQKLPAQVVYGLCAGYLVLLHYKTLLFIAPLVGLLIYESRSKKAQLPWVAILIVSVFITYFFISLHHWFGVWNPTKIYLPDAQLGLSPFATIPAMLFDANRGLLVNSPVWIMVFSGLPIWYRRHKKSLLFALVATVPSIGLLSIFSQWQGGTAPIGRYLMEFLPIFLPAAAFTIQVLSNWWEKLAVVLLVVATCYISVDTILTKIQYIDPGVYRTRPVVFQQIERHTRVGIDHLFPNYSNKTTLNDKLGETKVGLDSLLVVGAVAYGYAKARRLDDHPRRTLKTRTV